MEPVYLFKLAAEKADWLGQRQAVISQNIANASTPGFAARDVKPFNSILQTAGVSMTAAHPMHLGAESNQPGKIAVETRGAMAWEVSHSGNSVRLEHELMKAGQVSSEYALQTSIIKSFHRMVMSVARA